LKSEKPVKGAKETLRNSDRIRTKIKRETKEKKIKITFG
jgi:hypothetical protein